GRFLAASIAGLINTDPNDRFIQNALAAAASKDVSSSGSIGRLLSFFGKADYNYADRYYVSLTLRRDGSSRLGPSHQWGSFPAIGLGWRLTQESFYPAQGLFQNAMLRVGYGITGNQNIPSGRIVSQFGGGTGDTY